MLPRSASLSLVVLIAAVMVSSLFAGVAASGPATGVGHGAPSSAAPAYPHGTVVGDIAPPRSAELSALVHPAISSYVIILPNGSVTGAASPALSVSGNTYSLTASASGAIVDERAGSVLDGGGFTLTTSPALLWGVQVNTTNNVTIEDLTIADESRAVEVFNSTDVTVVTLTAAPTTSTAFLSIASTEVTFAQDSANDSNIGFGANFSSEVYFDYDYANSAKIGFESYQATEVYVQDVVGLGDRDGADLIVSVYVYVENSNFTGALSFGVFLALDTFAYVASDVAEGCGAGIAALQVTNFDLLSSNFTKAATAGAELGMVDGGDIQADSFGSSAGSGLVIEDGGGDSVSHSSSNGSAISGIVIGNVTSASLSDNYATHNEYNGLAITDSYEVESRGDNFSDTVNGNGTLTVHTTANQLIGDTDSQESNGVFDAASDSLSVNSTNASNDVGGFAFLDSISPSLRESVAENDTAYGAGVQSSNEYTVEDDRFIADGAGFESDGGSAGSVLNCVSTGSGVGFFFDEDSNSYVAGDSVLNSAFGFFEQDSVRTLLSDLTVFNATLVGLDLVETNSVSLQGSNISGSQTGVGLDAAEFTNISGNTFYNDTNDFDIPASGMFGAEVYWNNFIDGKGWVFLSSGAVPDAVVFDAGYPGGGNYWNNLTTPDIEHGPGQNLSGPDGIVDVPMEIGGTFMDHYPLTRPINASHLIVEFRETGLPAFSSWSVHFGSTAPFNQNYYGMGGYPIGVETGAAAWANYSYSVNAVAGWSASPASGTIVMNGSAVVVTIAFTPVTYATTFHEVGLAAGTGWSVRLNGTAYSGNGTSIVVALDNGTHNYTVTPVVGYVTAPASGSVVVDANESSVTIAFTAVLYAVTFTESGLPSGTSWTVEFGGAPRSSAGTAITFQVANGSYDFQVANVSGYSLTGASGVQRVSGPGASVTVAYTANPSSTSSEQVLFWALLAAVIVLAVLVVVLLLRGKKKSEPTPAVAGWTAPATGATPGPTGTPGGPPPGAVAPPPPNWKET